MNLILKHFIKEQNMQIFQHPYYFHNPAIYNSQKLND